MGCWPVPKSTAKLNGTMPTRISMIRPMPFCPSLEPCAKLTPVQVSTSKDRIHSGGALPGSGAEYRSWRLMSFLQSSRSKAAQQNPMIGETRSEMPISLAFTQLTPSPNSWEPEAHELARPTPIMAPISVCELEAGRPKYQVPRFHRIAESSNANTMANPAPEPTLSTSSTGSSASTPNATAPLDVNTPIRFQQPDHTTAIFG